jgi:hypothetical protein
MVPVIVSFHLIKVRQKILTAVISAKKLNNQESRLNKPGMQFMQKSMR